MKIHEYQARALLQQFQIPVPNAEVIFDPAQAAAAFQKLADPGCVVKVQVLAGGRGKAGGIRIVKTAEEAETASRSFIGKPFSTVQSAGAAAIVKAVLIASEVRIREEYYLGVLMDRTRRQPTLLFCKEGGVDIEEVAAKKPEAIQKIPFSPDAPPAGDAVFSVLSQNFKDESTSRQIAQVAAKLARLFVEKDASICEINPLVLTQEGNVQALDAKILFDDNALFRHEDLRALKDPEEEDERERKAKEFGLSYVSMNGNVGCLVNGAGLAMATMDMIKLAGGEPANFLDVGGGATADQVREGFKIILEDRRVKAILVNIFGGIMKCDVIAEGVIQASAQMKLQVPLIVRLEGTRVNEGRDLLKRSDLRIISCNTIKEAADAAVREARSFESSHVHSR
ncbi:MAG: ADP-forming succinate--CoA ligase subunit beta [Candidatus Omnitrophota bacterium]